MRKSVLLDLLYKYYVEKNEDSLLIIKDNYDSITIENQLEELHDMGILGARGGRPFTLENTYVFPQTDATKEFKELIED